MNPDVPLELFEHGSDRGRGNLVGIQPFMERADYGSQTALYQKLDVFFQRALDAGFFGPQTVVVLPEHIGTWLVAEGEGPAVLAASTLSAALRGLVLRHPAAFLREMLRGREKDRAAASLFRVKSAAMARAYQAVFSRLAKTYGITLAGGSILLASPRVVDGRICTRTGPLFNSAFVFHSDGGMDPRISSKIFPVESELPFVACASLHDIPVYPTPAGPLGVMVCADSWFPQVYQQLKEAGTELLAVPSAVLPASSWDEPWKGYSGWPIPDGVDRTDIGRLTERQAWAKYAMSGRIGDSGARAGMNVFLYGDLWDLGLGGGQWRLADGATRIEASQKGPAIINLWL